MDEPLYQYVKGQGWVVTSTDNVATMYCGTRVRLEMREPEPGEYWNGGWSKAYKDLSFWIERAAFINFCDLCIGHYVSGEKQYQYICVYTPV